MWRSVRAGTSTGRVSRVRNRGSHRSDESSVPGRGARCLPKVPRCRPRLHSCPHGHGAPMTSRSSTEAAKPDLRHVRREIRTALELAIVTLAPTKTVDRLATIAGLLEAVAELPADAPPVIALLSQVSSR